MLSTDTWKYESPLPWNSYLEIWNDQQMLAVQGQKYNWKYDGKVNCSHLGLFWEPVAVTDYILIAWTKVKLTSGTNGDCSVTPICANNVIPACPITFVLDLDKTCWPAYNCESLAYRYIKSHPYSCFINVCQGTSNTAPGNCTPWQ